MTVSVDVIDPVIVDLHMNGNDTLYAIGFSLTFRGRDHSLAFVLGRLCVCLAALLVACSAPRPSDAPAQPAASAEVTQLRRPGAADELPSRDVGSPQPSAAAPSEPAQAASAPAPAPDAKPDDTGWGVAAGLRYLEILRGDAVADDELPMIIVLHGLGDKPSRDWLSAIDLDPSLKARMILPQAPTPYGPGFSWFPFRSRDQDSAERAADISQAEAGLMRAVEQLTRMRPTRGRVIVCGFSQGGMLSFALALARPQQFQLALPISGMLSRPLWPESKPRGFLPRIVALHGDADPVVSFDASSQLVQHLRELQYPAEIVAYKGVGHQISGAMSLRLRDELNAAVLAIAGKPAKADKH